MFDGPNLAQGTVIGGGDVRAVSYGEDKGLFVEFRNEPFYNEFQSLATGKAVYDNKTMVRIYTPGDKTKVVDRLVREDDQDGYPSDPRRWPAQWAAFQNGKRAEVSGTPLGTWPLINAAQVKEFNAVNIYTVEQLADLSDTALDGLGHGGRSMRDGAIAYISRAKDEGAFAKMEQRHAQEMESMSRRIAELQASISSPEEAKRGPGRPRKEETE